MNIDKILTTVDTHTAGGPTRTITAGLPHLAGKSVAEKMEDFKKRFDAIRKLLMREPRGHRDMSGAVLIDPVHPEADLGAFFITASGYLPACVHSSIGVATAGLETGFIPQEKLHSRGSIKMEIPAGLISLAPIYRDKVLNSIALQTAPAFVHTPDAKVLLDGGLSVEGSIVFSGVFFFLLDVGLLKNFSPHTQPPLSRENAKYFAAIGPEILAAANRSLEVSHPDKPGSQHIELVMFYEELGDRAARDVVIGRSGGIDRSPCGAGTGARLAHLFSQGMLAPGEDYVLESFLGTRFTGRILQPSRVGSFDGAIPQIEGSAYITGVHQFILDSEDPIREGFIF